MKKMIIIGLLSLTGLLFFIFSIRNVWQYGQLLLANQMINVVQVLGDENMSERLLTHMYGHVKDDYCLLNRDKENFVFKYTLNRQFTYTINEAEELFNTILKSQHGQGKIDCTGVF